MSLRSNQREDGESTSGSSEAKTDRYGFLLVNGDTNNDSSDDPCPELVRHREKKWVTLISRWDQVLEKKHNKIKAQCQKGIPASVRSRCWPLLCGAKQRQENNNELYKTLESSPGQQSWIDVIKRDTDRQFPFHEMFQSENSHGQQGLLKVLKAYTQFRPDEGYCQAQGPVAAVLLMNMPLEEAFWCLVQISELYLPGYYSPLLEGVLFDAAILFAVLKRTCPAAYKHMQRQGVEPLMFATDWLMCLYSRHLPFNTLLRVWDLFFCNGARVLFQVAVVLVRRCLGEARQRKECEGQMETLERLRSVKGRVQHEQADAFIQEVCSVPLSLADLQRQTEKELEKWRKERPGSTFDPRDRCHGYHMIWEKGKEREKEAEKKKRQSGNLSVSVVRSHSTLSPAILRKKWRKRGSKADTEAWEGQGLLKQDSDNGEKRRASLCGVAGELQAKTPRTPQELSTHLQKDGNTITDSQCTSATVTQPSSESPDPSDSVFVDNENNAAVTAIPSHSEETRLKEDPLQTGNSHQDIEKQHCIETQQDKEKKVQTPGDDQNEEISTHDQPHAETRQEDLQPFQPEEEEEDAKNKVIEQTQENRSKQEEETEIKSGKPEEEVKLNIGRQEQEVITTQQEVEAEVNTDTQEQKICTCKEEQEKGTKNKHKEEGQLDIRKQEEEMGTNDRNGQEVEIQGEQKIKADSSEQEVKIQQEQEIKAKSNKQEAKIQQEQEIKADSSKQEAKIQGEQEIKADSSEQEVEIQGEQEIKANSSEQEVEIQGEQEIKADSSKQEVEIQQEQEIKADSSEQEVEIQGEQEIKANSSKQEAKIQQEQEIKADSSEQEVEIQREQEIKADSSEQDVEIQGEQEIKADSSEQEVEIQQEQEIQTDSSEQEVEIQGEQEIKTESCEQEVEIQGEQEIKADSSEQEVEIQQEQEIKADSSEQEVEIQQEQEIKTDSSEQKVEIPGEQEIKAESCEQEVEIKGEQEIKTESSKQDTKIQDEKDIKADSSEKEVEIQDEKDIKADSSEKEVEIQDEKDIKVDRSENEVEIQDGDKLANNADEEQNLKTCLIPEENVHNDEQQQQEVSEQTNEVEQSLKTEEQMCLNVQISEAQEGREKEALFIHEVNHVKGELCEIGSRTNKEMEGERKHSEEIETETRISDAPGEETAGTIVEKKKSCTVDQDEPETAVFLPHVQPETVTERSGKSETPEDSKQTQDKNMEVNQISTSEHGGPDRTSGSNNPETPQPDIKENETKITTESNPGKPAPSGSNPHPQLRLRRSSSSHMSYPTILSEDAFRDPQQSTTRESCSQTTKSEEMNITHPTQTQSSNTEDPQKPRTQSKSDKPKRRGLFHRLRAETPSKSTIPKIVIQDFSEGEEKLSSKERRRQRRVQERKEKEEEKERKKLEKELEKEKDRARKKPQTRGKSFQVLSRKHGDDDEVFSGSIGSQTQGRKRNTYSESYF